MMRILEPSVTANQELIVPAAMSTISSMEKTPELLAFSKRLHQICDKKSIPRHGRQTELGRIFGVSQKGARKWLEAESWPRWETLIQITEWGNVNIEWLMTGRDEIDKKNLAENKGVTYLINLYTQADERGQESILRVAEAEANYINTASDEPIPGEYPRTAKKITNKRTG